MMSIVADDRHRFPIVPREHSLNPTTMPGLERHTLTDLELKHLDVRVHLLEQTQTLHDPAVEINQLRLGEFVNVDLHPGTLGRFGGTFSALRTVGVPA